FLPAAKESSFSLALFPADSQKLVVGPAHLCLPLLADRLWGNIGVFWIVLLLFLSNLWCLLLRKAVLLTAGIAETKSGILSAYSQFVSTSGTVHGCPPPH